MTQRGFGGEPELMIVVAIIGILSAIAIPQFAKLIRKANEDNTRGNLGFFRQTIRFHQYDYRGLHPYHPRALTVRGKYLGSIPKAKMPNYHPESDAVRLGLSSKDSDDAGGWLYIGAPGLPQSGAIFVNCTHTDPKGSLWINY